MHFLIHMIYATILITKVTPGGVGAPGGVGVPGLPGSPGDGLGVGSPGTGAGPPGPPGDGPGSTLQETQSNRI